MKGGHGQTATITHKHEPDSHVHWLRFRADAAPVFTSPRLHEMRFVFDAICAAARSNPEWTAPVPHLVLCSESPGVFSYGGDLHAFTDAIRRSDRAALTRYAKQAIDLVLWGEHTDGACISTIAMLEGDAFAGGLEAARACHVVIAEESCRFSLPEVAFGLFPGMGAFTLLAHHGSIAFAERMILSGERFTAAEMAAAGIIDEVVGDGQAEQRVREIISTRHRASSAHRSMRELRRARPRVTRKELEANITLWVDCAMQLGEAGAKRMATLSRTQSRQRTRTANHLSAPAGCSTSTTDRVTPPPTG